MVGASGNEHVTVYMIGDSTMADKPDPEQNPERGWGQLLPLIFDGRVRVRNFAVNGRSSKSFEAERWAEICAELKPADYVFIQFGHNDQKREDPARYTNPYTGYRRNLERFVAETRARGGIPVLFSSIVRRTFNQHGVLEDTHGAYPFVARAVAEALKVSFIDLQLLTEDLVLILGPERSKKLYLWLEPGQSALYPQGLCDDTHLSEAGALAIAWLAAQELRQSDLPLARFVIDEQVVQ